MYNWDATLLSNRELLNASNKGANMFKTVYKRDKHYGTLWGGLEVNETNEEITAQTWREKHPR